MAQKSKLSSIEKRKRLEALFDRGDYVRLNRDANGRPVINSEESPGDMRIWVGPPSPLEREMAVREAQAARARVMIDARDNHDSQTWLTIQNFVRSMKRDALVDYILELDENEHFSQARRDVLQQKEWEDFNSFRDAMRQWDEAGSPIEDPEWEPLLERDRKFGMQVIDRVDEIRDDARAGYMHMPLNAVQELAVGKRVEQAGTAAFMSAYEEWILFYACRDDDDHSAYFFDSPDGIKRLPDEVHGALAEKLRSFISDSSEAKN